MAEIIQRAQARAKATGSTVTMDDAVAAVREARESPSRTQSSRQRSRRVRRRAALTEPGSPAANLLSADDAVIQVPSI